MSLEINNVILSGNLTQNPELRYTPSGKAVCSCSIAVNNKYKKQDGTDVDRTMFIDIEAWGGTAEAMGQYASKGMPILVQGSLELDTWEAKDGGGKRSKHKITIEKIKFVGNKEKNAAPKKEEAPAGGGKSNPTNFDDFEDDPF